MRNWSAHPFHPNVLHWLVQHNSLITNPHVSSKWVSRSLINISLFSAYASQIIRKKKNLSFHEPLIFAGDIRSSRSGMEIQLTTSCGVNRRRLNSTAWTIVLPRIKNLQNFKISCSFFSLRCQFPTELFEFPLLVSRNTTVPSRRRYCWTQTRAYIPHIEVQKDRSFWLNTCSGLRRNTAEFEAAHAIATLCACAVHV